MPGFQIPRPAGFSHQLLRSLNLYCDTMKVHEKFQVLKIGIFFFAGKLLISAIEHSKLLHCPGMADCFRGTKGGMASEHCILAVPTLGY